MTELQKPFNKSSKDSAGNIEENLLSNMGKTISEELLDALAPEIDSGDIVVVSDYDAYFDLIWHAFPFVGSKISWLRVPHSYSMRFDDDKYEASIHLFFDEVVRQAGLRPTDRIVVLGDSAMNFALSLTVNALTQHLKEIVDMPQHTYIIPNDITWCACYTMEGYMDFGFRPSG